MNRQARPDEPRSQLVTEYVDNGSPDARALFEHDVQNVLQWLNDQPLRTITSQQMIMWTKQQQPPWTSGYRKRVLDQVAELMKEQTQAAVATVKAHLLTLIDRLIPECRSPVVSGGDLVLDKRSSEYRRWIELKSADDAWAQYDRRKADHDQSLARQANGGPMAPETPLEPRAPRLTEQDRLRMAELAKCLPYLSEINHTAAQGYLKMVGQLTGAMLADKEGDKHVHFHAALKKGDLSLVSQAELESGMAYLEQVNGSPDR